MQSTLAPGSTLGSYRIKGLLGKGGMGEVYLAEDKRLKRDVALKVLPAQFTADPDRMNRFTQEARSASALNHPNIVTVFDICESGEVPFIAMEFIAGSTLRQRIQDGDLALKLTLDIAAQSAIALAAAHQAGIVHRDIKPDNIMIRDDGYVKILDFGLAKLTGLSAPPKNDETAAMDVVNTEAGAVMGTTQYMSPEQARGLPLDGRSDIFSFGVTLYEMIAGRPPFQGATPSHVVVALLEKEAEPLSQISANVPREVEDIVEKALAKDRDERYQTAKDLAVDLKRALRKLDTHSGHGVVPSPGSSPAVPIASDPPVSVVPAARATRKFPAAATLLILALLLATGGYALYRWQPWRGRPAFERFRLTQLTNSGKAQNPALSPDGRYIIYQVCDKGQCGLWLRQTATASNVAIVPPSEGDYGSLTYSPDGNSIYFVHYERGAGSLYQMPALGGAPRLILEDVVRVAIHPSGKRAAVIRLENPETSVQEISLEGSSRTKVVSRRLPDFILGLTYTPDGRSLTYLSAKYDPIECAGRQIDGTGSDRLLFSKKWVFDQSVAWLPGARELLFLGRDVSENTPSQLWRFNSKSGEVTSVTSDLSRYAELSLSQDGQSLAMARTESRATLWTVRIGQPSSLREVTTADSRSDGRLGMALLKNGSVVFASTTNNSPHLWVTDWDGGNLRQLTSEAVAELNPEVTSDGSTIVHAAMAKGATPQVWAIDADGRNPRQLTKGSGSVYFTLAGSDLLYTELGKKGLFRTPLKGGPIIQIAVQAEPEGDLAVSPDGQTLAYTFRDATANRQLRIAFMSIAGGNHLQAGAPLPGRPIRLQWAANGEAILYALQDHGVTRIVKQPLKGTASTLFELSNEEIFSFVLSADGSQLMISRGRLLSDIVLMTDER